MHLTLIEYCCCLLGLSQTKPKRNVKKKTTTAKEKLTHNVVLSFTFYSFFSFLLALNGYNGTYRGAIVRKGEQFTSHWTINNWVGEHQCYCTKILHILRHNLNYSIPSTPSYSWFTYHHQRRFDLLSQNPWPRLGIWVDNTYTQNASNEWTSNYPYDYDDTNTISKGRTASIYY